MYTDKISENVMFWSPRKTSRFCGSQDLLLNNSNKKFNFYWLLGFRLTKGLSIIPKISLCHHTFIFLCSFLSVITIFFGIALVLCMM